MAGRQCDSKMYPVSLSIRIIEIDFRFIGAYISKIQYLVRASFTNEYLCPWTALQVFINKMILMKERQCDSKR